MQLEIFFPSAYNATMATYLLHETGGEVSEPRMVPRPFNGRAWVLTVDFPTMSSAERYVAPEQRSIINQAMAKFDGAVPGNEYAHLADG